MSRRGWPSQLVGVATLIFAVLLLGPSLALATNSHPLQFKIGLTGTGELLASGIAIDAANGNVAVTANAAEEIQLFGAEGGPPSGVANPVITGLPLGDREPAGLAFDNSATSPSKGALYAVGTALGARKFVLNPTTHEYELAAALNPAGGFAEPLGVAVNAKGQVFVANYGGAIIEFAPDGTEIGRLETQGTGILHPSGLAFDATGDLYVQSYAEAPIYKYEANGAGEIPSSTTPTIFATPSTQAKGVAVDTATGAIYTTSAGNVTQFSSDGTQIQEFGEEFGEGQLDLERLAVGPNGEIYTVSRRTDSVVVFGAEGIPTVATGAATALTATSATLSGTVNPEGVALTSCNFQYVTEAAYLASGFSDLSSGGEASCEPPASDIPADSESHAVSASVSGLSVGTSYRARLVAGNVSGRNRGAGEPFKTLGFPLVEAEHVVSALQDEATVEATINPEGSSTTAFVEFGLTTGYGRATTPVAVGSDRSGHVVRVNLNGLQPGVSYHWRFVANNEQGKTEGADNTLDAFGSTGTIASCPNEIFRTGAASRLADCRGYEMVSPIDKNNGDIVSMIEFNSNLAMLNQSALSGNTFTYTTAQAFGDAQGAPYVSQYVASRSDQSGWSSRAIATPQEPADTRIEARLELEYQLFSPELCQAVLLNYNDEPLAPGGSEHASNIYRNRLCGGGLETVTTVPNTNAEEVPIVEGMSADERCIVFQIGMIYENCGAGSQPVSVRPDGALGEGFVGTPHDVPYLRTSSLTNAISENGSRVYFTAGEGLASGGGSPAQLLVRLNAQQPQSALDGSNNCTELGKACTVALSSEDPALEGEGIYEGASADGSRAIYLLTAGDQLGESTEARSVELREFNAETRNSSLIAGGALGVMGMSSDARRVYFVSEEVLATGGVAGEPNLYLYDADLTGASRFRFVARMSERDARQQTIDEFTPINEVPYWRTARVTSNGLNAVFWSTARLTGYDNTDVQSGEADNEVFIYNASAADGRGELYCVSCNPTGQRPEGRNVPVAGHVHPDRPSWGAALITPYTTSFYGPRVVSDDGNKVFFDSYEPLVLGDSNGRADVYEWEKPGSGTCTVSAGSYSPGNGGCITLISGGESPTDSEFVDADPTGANVFFRTGQSLVEQDPGAIDIYDAREGGGFPAPSRPAAACEGEACQRPASPPADLTPSSASFSGPGNLVSSPLATVKSKKTPAQLRVERLAKALKRCRKDKSRRKSVACERSARKRYGARAVKRKKVKRVNHDTGAGR